MRLSLNDLKSTKAGQLPSNQHVFNPMPAVASAKRQSHQRRESQDRVVEKVPAGVGFCITIVSFRNKLVDQHDNLRTGAKPLVDRITQWLGFASDDDPRLIWEYSQIKTTGRPETIVRIDPYVQTCHYDYSKARPPSSSEHPKESGPGQTQIGMAAGNV